MKEIFNNSQSDMLETNANTVLSTLGQGSTVQQALDKIALDMASKERTFTDCLKHVDDNPREVIELDNFAGFNVAVRTLTKGETHLVSASSGAGKSYFTRTLAMACVSNGKRVRYVSLETSMHDDFKHFEELRDVVEATNPELDELLKVNNMEEMEVTDIKGAFNAYCGSDECYKGMDVVIIDATERGLPAGKDAVDIHNLGESVVSSIKALARKHKVAVVVTAQFRGTSTKGTDEDKLIDYDIKDIAGSSLWVTDAYKIILIRKNWLIVKKSRSADGELESPKMYLLSKKNKKIGVKGGAGQCSLSLD